MSDWREDIEVQVFNMKELADGSETIAERGDDISSYSVLVRRVNENDVHDVLLDEDYETPEDARMVADAVAQIFDTDWEEVGG